MDLNKVSSIIEDLEIKEKALSVFDKKDLDVLLEEYKKSGRINIDSVKDRITLECLEKLRDGGLVKW